MAGQSMSAWLDEATAKDLAAVSRLEARPPSHVTSAALKFYLRLPEEARSALRKIEALGTEDEIKWALRRVTRALLDAQWEVATQRAAEQIETASGLGTEKEIETAARALTRGR